MHAPIRLPGPTLAERLQEGLTVLLADNAGLPFGLHTKLRPHLGGDASLDIHCFFPTQRRPELETDGIGLAKVFRWAKLRERDFHSRLYESLEFGDLQNVRYRSQGIGTILVNATLLCAAPLLQSGAKTRGKFSDEEGVDRRTSFYAGYGFPHQSFRTAFSSIHPRPPNPRRRFSVPLPDLNEWKAGSQHCIAHSVATFACADWISFATPVPPFGEAMEWSPLAPRRQHNRNREWKRTSFSYLSDIEWRRFPFLEERESPSGLNY